MEIVATCVAFVLRMHRVRIGSIAPGVGTILLAFLWVVALNKAHPAATYARTAFDDSLHSHPKAVRFIQRMFQIIEIVRHSYVHIRYHASCVLIGDEHLIMVNL